MPSNDWLVGGDRRAIAAERIYDMAADLIARNGVDAFDVDTLATQVPCSRATIYRYAGGKTEIRDAVLARASARIVDKVRAVVDHLSGPERIVTTITVALELIRSDPLSQLMISSFWGCDHISRPAASPVPLSTAVDLAALTQLDAQAGQWIMRVVLSLLYWPTNDADSEQQTLQRFVAPAFTEWHIDHAELPQSRR